MKKCEETGKICLTGNEAKKKFEKLEQINSSYLCPYCGYFHVSSMSRKFYFAIAKNAKPKPKQGIQIEHIQNRIKNLKQCL